MVRAPAHRLQSNWRRLCALPHREINTDVEDLLGRTLVCDVLACRRDQQSSACYPRLLFSIFRTKLIGVKILEVCRRHVLKLLNCTYVCSTKEQCWFR